MVSQKKLCSSRGTISHESDVIQLWFVTYIIEYVNRFYHSCPLSLSHSFSKSLSCSLTQAQSQAILHPFLSVSVCPSPYHIVKNEPSAENSSADVTLNSFGLFSSSSHGKKKDFAVSNDRATTYRGINCCDAFEFDKAGSLPNAIYRYAGIAGTLLRQNRRVRGTAGEGERAWENGNLGLRSSGNGFRIRAE